MENIKNETKQAVSELREDARQAGSQLKQKAREATDQIKEQGRELAMQQKETVAGSLDHVGSALRTAAHQLHEDQEQRVAGAAEKLADKLDQATHYLRTQDFNRIYADAQGYIRQHPELVFGTLFFAGLAIGRFLKATPYEMPMRDLDQEQRRDQSHELPVATTTETPVAYTTNVKEKTPVPGVAPAPVI